jgi:fimbrial chaperone protein
MRSILATSAAVAFLVAAGFTPAKAGSLQVEPVLVDVTAPGAASTLSLRNVGTATINAQIRVFRWSLVNGEEKLEPTDDVVASPPTVVLAPNAKNIARIVRVSKQPVVGEESYRLLIDQLPDLSQQKNGAINLMVRYSIPVFFGAAGKKIPAVVWSVAVKGDKVTLAARNTGDRRLRISALTLRDANGRNVSLGNGLAGYALGQSTKSWTIKGHGFSPQGSASISAQSDGGPIRAVASIGR